MSQTSFDIDKELYISGKGSLNDARLYLNGKDLSQSLPCAVEIFNALDKHYMKSIKNDGKIIGQERSDLLEQIDIFFDMIILFWKSFSSYDEETFISIVNNRSNFYLNIIEEKGFWEANGQLTSKMFKPAKNFVDIYNNILSVEIVSMLKIYKDISFDNVITEDEKKEIRYNIKQVLYYTLFFRIQIELCLINN